MGSVTTTSEPLVGIIIVHYNCLADTKRCLNSLLTLRHENYQVMVIDSGSPDRSGPELIQLQLDSRVQVVLSPDNIGFAAANNIGLRYYKVLKADYVWLLNPDTEVESETLSKLVESSVVSGGAVCGSKVLFAKIESSGVPKIWGAGGFLDVSKQEVSMRGSGEEDHGQYEEETECSYIPGCSLLLPRRALELAGPIPESYFMFFEETDWCMRMSRAGIKLRYVPQSVVKHHWEAKGERPLNIYYYNRNRRYFWAMLSEPLGRKKQYRQVMFSEFPQAVWAWWKAPNEKLREVFLAHVRSCLDFLRGRLGKRSDYH